MIQKMSRIVNGWPFIVGGGVAIIHVQFRFLGEGMVGQAFRVGGGPGRVHPGRHGGRFQSVAVRSFGKLAVCGVPSFTRQSSSLATNPFLCLSTHDCGISDQGTFRIAS
jgi:hypothetical protein